ncbi:MAG: adenine nucleotide alpha hydrolase [Tropicimonas sp.]|uniref:adenine nucleotide alpha hydrolase n=1 Tax=Tropicimonas sp. TaxID=2067044 RepID=UPI003A860149
MRAIDRLNRALLRHERITLAVSGGVDSMTLAHVAHAVLPGDAVEICHALSPAVPAGASARVADHAARHGWRLHRLDAGEFADPDYLRNPVNRCYFCKSNLYRRIRETVSGPVASGANTDDLGDYRPGLEAARELGIVHPFIEAECSKADVRAIARSMGLDDLSELPAQPCLASRIETGLRVTPEDLRFIEETEAALTRLAPGETLRCRVVAGGVRIEMSDVIAGDRILCRRLRQVAQECCTAAGRPLVALEPYRRGSAFLHAS